jgi:hypothetical protein
VKKAEVMSIEDVNFKIGFFDSVLMMGNNFSLFGGFKKAQRLLNRFHGITTEDALIIAETLDSYETDNPAYFEYYEVNKKRGKMSGQIRCRIRFENYVSK